jgi:hypothetical protein
MLFAAEAQIGNGRVPGRDVDLHLARPRNSRGRHLGRTASMLFAGKAMGSGGWELLWL